MSEPELLKVKIFNVLSWFGSATETQGDFDKNASIGFAWSNDLLDWNWQGNKINYMIPRMFSENE